MSEIRLPSLAQAERLAYLMEEMAEAQQIIGKILRHGYDNHHPDSPTPNKDLLQLELGHVLTAMDLMASSGDISEEDIANISVVKLKDVMKYMHFQDPAEGKGSF
jgi:hypothetical protein